MYRSHYRNLLRLIYELDAEEQISQEDLEKLANTYFTTNRNYQRDLERFFVHLKDRPPLTIAISIAVVKTLPVRTMLSYHRDFGRVQAEEPKEMERGRWTGFPATPRLERF